MERTWRIILDKPKDAYYNMAKDEALLLHYKKSRLPVFRIYSWDTPSVSLGYRQKAEDVLNVNMCRRLKVPFVRRITGGGAIFHHKEITYSLVCERKSLGFPRGVKESYKLLNAFLINFYSKLGLKASFACDIYKDAGNKADEICFMSFEPYDIVIGGRKAGGNAQRRSRDIIFQHGSIPIDVDYTMLPYLFKDYRNLRTDIFLIKNIVSKESRYNILQKKLMDSLAETFNVRFKNISADDEENSTIEHLLFSRYYKKEWNFNFNNEKTSVA